MEEKDLLGRCGGQVSWNSQPGWMRALGVLCCKESRDPQNPGRVREILPLGFSPLCYVIPGKDPWRENALTREKWGSFWDGIQYLSCSKSKETNLWTFLSNYIFIISTLMCNFSCVGIFCEGKGY